MFKLLKEVKWVVMMEALILYRRGWRATLTRSHEAAKLELPTTWKPLDRSKPLQDCENPWIGDFNAYLHAWEKKSER